MRILLVGGGGIGCQLMGVLALTHDVTVVDGDSYEPKNCTRQFPALESTENKAIALVSRFRNAAASLVAIDDFFRKEDFDHCDWDVVISAVDNNRARMEIHEWAEQWGIPAILAGNEEHFGEAYLAGASLDPRQWFDFPTRGSYNPARCNSDAVLDESPQTATANFYAAACALQVLHSLNTVKARHNTIGHSRMDVSGSKTTTIKRLIDPLPEYDASISNQHGQPAVAQAAVC